MSSETDDMKNVSISVIKVNDSKDTTNSGDDNNLSVATIDESQLIGTSFTDSDQNLTLDEEALLKSPEISFLKYTDLEQHSVIKEDENLIQHSHSIAENCTVENSAVEEYFEHENDMVANVSQVKVNPRGIEDLALEEKEETGAIREHCEITSAMQISSGPEVKLSEINLIHHIKNIQFKDNKIGIVTQNENGT